MNPNHVLRLLACGALLIAAPRAGAPSHHHGNMLGAASGIIFGASDVSIKALTGIVGAHGVLGLARVTMPITWPAP